MKDWVAIKNPESYKESFTSADPYSHIVIDNFLHEDKLQPLLDALEHTTFHEKSSDLFQFLQTDDFNTLTDQAFLDFKQAFFSEEFVSFIEKITGFSLSTKPDMFVSVYQDTDFLLCHDDKIGTRKLAFLLYLNDIEENEGGALELYDSENDLPVEIVKKVIPKKNRFAMFEVSEKSFHAVEEVTAEKQRIALTGWYHVQ